MNNKNGCCLNKCLVSQINSTRQTFESEYINPLTNYHNGYLKMHVSVCIYTDFINNCTEFRLNIILLCCIVDNSYFCAMNTTLSKFFLKF